MELHMEPHGNPWSLGSAGSAPVVRLLGWGVAGHGPPRRRGAARAEGTEHALQAAAATEEE